MTSFDPGLIAAHSRRWSVIERASDVLRINRFFLRRGRPPIISSDPDVLVSPVHCRVAWVGSIRGDEVVPGKPVLGRQRLWSLSEILWDETLAQSFEQGLIFNLYLAPTDLHYIISPATAKIEFVRLCPGRCWPIIFWKIGEIENERIVTLLNLQDEQRLAMVLVGSFLVSGILFLKNRGDVLTQGEVIGGFKVGSTVFLIFGANQVTPLIQSGDRLLLGEPFARLVK